MHTKDMREHLSQRDGLSRRPKYWLVSVVSLQDRHILQLWEMLVNQVRVVESQYTPLD